VTDMYFWAIVLVCWPYTLIGREIAYCSDGNTFLIGV
jgi:hypothetical protein